MINIIIGCIIFIFGLYLFHRILANKLEKDIDVLKKKDSPFKIVSYLKNFVIFYSLYMLFKPLFNVLDEIFFRCFRAWIKFKNFWKSPLYNFRNLLFGSKLKRRLSNKRKSLLQERLEDFVDWMSDLYTDLFIIPYETLCRFLYWGWKLRHSYEWEAGHGLYYMIYLKTKGLIDYSRDHAHLCWNNNEDGTEFRKLKIACNLAKRLWEEDYHTHREIHNKKWGNKIEFDFLPHSYDKDGKPLTYSMISINEQRRSKEENEKERKEYRIAIEKDQQQDSERKYLMELLFKYMDRWWD